MTNISPKNRLDAIDVLRLPDGDAVRWLKEKSCYESCYKQSRSSLSPEQKLHRIASFAFSRRGSKRLRLAVARYGSHVRTLRNLFNKGTRSERLAVLSNPYIGPQKEDFLLSFSPELVLSKSAAEIFLQNQQSNTREFAVFASNPNINREWLADRISSWLETKDFDTNGLLSLVDCLVDNPIINARRDEAFMDGLDEFLYYELNYVLADLLQTVPVTIYWADVLSRMLPNLYLSHAPDFEVDLIERWKDPEPTENGEHFYFHGLREQITRHLIVRNHRSEITEKYSIDHDDPAVRKGFYLSLKPYEVFDGIYWDDFRYPSFKCLDSIKLSESQQQFVDLCKRYFDRDKNDFVESLIRNENFWKTKKDREFLRDIAWHLADDPHSSLDVPNLYNSGEKYHLEHNPSFFKDDELTDVPYEHTVDGKLSNLQKKLNKLYEEIKSLPLEEIRDEQRAHFQSIIEYKQSEVRSLSGHMIEKSVEIAALESRIIHKNGLIWALVIVIAVMFFLNMN
jgi:hypothetical protein